MALPRRRKAPGDEQHFTFEDVTAAIEKRLFLARLPPGTSQQELTEVFEEFGKVTECRMVPFKNVAFIGFEKWANAHQALTNTDGLKSLANHREGQTLSACFAERTNSVGRGGGAHLKKGDDNCRVFVGSLPADMSNEDLSGLFSPYGEVVAATLLTAKGQRRCGFVNFSMWGEAMDAVEALDGVVYPEVTGEPITVVIAEPPRDGGFVGGGGGGGGPPLASLKPAAAVASERGFMGGGGWGSWRDRALEGGDDFLEAAGKRRRAGGYGSLPFVSASDRKAEFDSLIVQYRVAIDSAKSSDETCEELHRALMDLRAAVLHGTQSRWERDGGHDRRGSDSRTRSNRWERAREQVQDERGGDDVEEDEELLLRGRTADRTLRERADRTLHERAPQATAHRLCISGLAKDCTDDELRTLLEQVRFRKRLRDSDVLECRVVPGRGIGYLAFTSREVAEEALDALDDRQVSGWPHPLRARWEAPGSGSGGEGHDRHGDGGGDERRPATGKREGGGDWARECDGGGGRERTRDREREADCERRRKAEGEDGEAAAGRRLRGDDGTRGATEARGGRGSARSRSASRRRRKKRRKEREGSRSRSRSRRRTDAAAGGGGARLKEAEGSSNPVLAAALSAIRREDEAIRSRRPEVKEEPGGCGEAASAREAAAAAREATRAEASSAGARGAAAAAADGENVDLYRLFVGQLRHGVSEESVTAAFEAFGKIHEVRLLHDKGVAYITFDSEEDAAEARKALNGECITGVSRGEGLNVKFAKTHRR